MSNGNLCSMHSMMISLWVMAEVYRWVDPQWANCALPANTVTIVYADAELVYKLVVIELL